jgi:aspartate ammonia-lyase
MDAESIKQLLNVEPSYWQNIDEDHVFCAQTEAHSLLTQIFLSSDDEEKQREVLTAIVEDDFGLLYLSLPFIGHDFSEIEEDEEQTSGSIEELLMKIKSLSEEAYREVMTVSTNGTLDNIENALKQNANKQRVTAVEMDTDDMFAPL